MSGNLVVVGSINIDMCIMLERIPERGETVGDGDFFMNFGGKGANQAVAAARLGGRVAMVGKVGQDTFGDQVREALQREGIVTELVSRAPCASGTALVAVDSQGGNAIAVAPGANGKLSPADVSAAADQIKNAGLLLMQLEIPLPTILEAANLAKRWDVPVVLNPAPATPLPREILQGLFCLTPNQTEAALLTGVTVVDAVSAEQAARFLLAQGVQNVVITMGEQGAAALVDGIFCLVPPRPVRAVDSTAAGDVFSGALCVGLLEGFGFDKALFLATEAASISVTRIGAQQSAPYRNELKMLS